MPNTSNITNMPDLKKLFVYVNFTGAGENNKNLPGLKEQLIGSSRENYPERVFYVANDGSIITHGQEFGVSDDLKTQINNLATDSVNFKSSIKNLTGIDVPVGEAAEITDDNSVIGKYVHKQILLNKTIVAAKANSGITVEETADGAGTKTYTVGLDQSVIVDDKTIVTDGGKLKTAVKLVKKYCADETPTVGSTFYDSKTNVPANTSVHPVILLTDKADAILDIVDGNEFVTDGMLDTVTYDDKEGTLTFTWNTASGKVDEQGNPVKTTIDIHKLFNIEGIHTTTPDYIEVKQEKAPFEDGGTGTEVDNKMEYHVSAKVDATDLTAMSTVTYTPGTPAAGSIVDAPLTPTTNANYTVNSEFNQSTDVTKNVSGLADAKKVADKIRAIDEKIVEVGNQAVAREKTITTGIDAKIADLKQKLTDEETARGNMDTNLYGEAIPVSGPVNTIKKNADAIAILNGADTVDGSVAQKIKALKDSLDAEVEYKDANNLVKVAVFQVDGVVVKKENAVTVKTAKLTVNVNSDAEYTLGTASPSGFTEAGGYKAKGLNEVAADDPSLVTNQDAWIYGQCIKEQAIKSIASDNNQYIKIVREDNKTKVAFEPWTEIHTIEELSKMDGANYTPGN